MYLICVFITTSKEHSVESLLSHRVTINCNNTEMFKHAISRTTTYGLQLLQFYERQNMKTVNLYL